MQLGSKAVFCEQLVCVDVVFCCEFDNVSDLPGPSLAVTARYTEYGRPSSTASGRPGQRLTSSPLSSSLPRYVSLGRQMSSPIGTGSGNRFLGIRLEYAIVINKSSRRHRHCFEDTADTQNSVRLPSIKMQLLRDQFIDVYAVGVQSDGDLDSSAHYSNEDDGAVGTFDN